MGKKNIYKRALAMDLVRLGNDLHHSMKNRNDKRFQVFVFEHTEKLDRDIAHLTNKPYIGNNYHDKN